MSRISIYSEWENKGVLEQKLIDVENMARNGLDQSQIAHNLGISIDTLISYKKKYKRFSDALERGKEVTDQEVENALLKRALGSSYTEVIETKDSSGKTKTVRVITREVPGDVTAQIFWLKNRKPNEWRDKRDVEMDADTDLNITIDYSDLSIEELKEIAEIK